MTLSNPLDLRGPEFLALYALLLFGAVAAALLIRWIAVPSGDASAARPWATRASADDLAFLARGRPGLLESALSALVASGRAVDDPAERGFSRAGQRTAFDGTPAVQAVFRALPGPGEVAGRRELLAALDPVVASIERRLAPAGLAVSPGTAARIGIASGVPLGVVALLGVAKISVGLSRGRPVLFLALLVLATAVFAAAFVTRTPVATRAAGSLLRHLRTRNAPLLQACGRPERLDPEQVALAVALFGATALTLLSVPFPAIRAMRNVLAGGSSAGGDSSWGSSCASSGCGGGGGCGGGCGGGGCGGCGS